MSDIAVEVHHVWKRFHRGEIHDSLRDLVPALAKRLVGRRRKQDELGEGDFWALRDVHFQVKRGEVLGIVGANGAGKSTLLKILARILRPNRGSIRVNGRLRALIEIAAGFHQDLTGRENIFLNGTILGMKRREIDAKFEEIVEFSGIGPFLDTPVKRYSSGMYARLGFAVAAHLEPEVLLVDEVLSVGDATFQNKCVGKMADVATSGRTVIFISHNMAAVQSLCTRAIVIREGSMAFEGATREAIAHYLGGMGAAGERVSLESRRDRWGTGAILFTSLAIQGVQRARQGPVVTGGEVTLAASFHCRDPQEHCNFGFHICDPLGQVIFRIITRDSVGALPRLGCSGKVTCTIPELRLLPGRYLVTVFASDNRTRTMLDHVRGAAEFEVHASDVFGTGNIPTQGLTYTPCSWSLQTGSTGPVSLPFPKLHGQPRS